MSPKKKYWLDCLFATLFVFLTLYGLKQLTTLNALQAFDPIGKALGDVELADVAFSELREDPVIDENVVIVNIGNLSRAGIAQQIVNISACKPRVIGLDIIFACDRGYADSLNCPEAYDAEANALFAMAAAGAPNLVMAQKLWQTQGLVDSLGDVQLYDSMEHTDADLRQTPYEGFVNLETDAGDQEDLKTCRRFNPVIEVNGEQELAFSVKMAMLYDSVKTKKLLARNKFSEVVNYRGNIVDWYGASNYAGRYAVLDVEQALDTSLFVPAMLEDKIVIMGFLGEDLRDTSWDDKFFTPLNKQYAGKSRPDMYGVVVHANIVSMILAEDYINELTLWQEYGIAFSLVFLNVMLFTLIVRRIPVWFDSLSLLVQVIQVVIMGYLMVQVMTWSNFKLNLTLSLAAVALVGTCFELYGTLVKRVLGSLVLRIPLLSRNEVLTKKESGV
jgi:CHASE2 domain-containing sensor protein